MRQVWGEAAARCTLLAGNRRDRNINGWQTLLPRYITAIDDLHAWLRKGRPGRTRRTEAGQEQLGLAELTHEKRNNRMRAR
jgi:hypothetical protein